MAQNDSGGVLIKVLIWLVILAVAGAGAAVVLMREPEVQVTAGEVLRGPVEETVASISAGTVMPEQRAMVAASMIGRIQQIYVQEGQRVTKGDLLVVLEHDDLDAQVNVARANLVAGRPRVSQAELGASIQEEVSATQTGQAQAQLDLAQREFARMESLARQNAIARADFDKAAAALAVARETAAAARAGAREREVRREDIVSAHAIIEQLEAALTAAEAMREKAFVRAPFDGVIAELLLEEGESVAMGLPLLHLVQDSTLYVEAPFDEANAAQIREGLQARIEVDAFSGEVFDGEVTYIAPMVSMNRDLSRTITVKVQLNNGQDKLLAGMSADVTVVSQRKEAALYVPSESLIRDQAAYVIASGRAVQQPVEVGIGNWEHREVLSGLTEGQTIITSIGIKELKEGVKVRVVEELPEE